MKKTILIVDDKQSVHDSLSMNFRDFGYDTVWARDSKRAMELLDTHVVAVVLLDLSLGSENGLDLLPGIKRLKPDVPVIMITGYGTLESAVRSIKIGAYDFLPKPLDFDKLKDTVEQALALHSAEAAPQRPADDFVPSSAPMVQNVYQRAKLLAKTNLSVLIIGESGAGKEHLVDCIHRESNRSAMELHRINCSAFPESLIDNELFGHEKGAFTGAQSVYSGLFERADKSTLHLDEIGDLHLASQAKLLRVLEDGRIRRLGGTDPIKVDVRIIASTNKDLPEMIAAGLFREDLFYRLNAAFLYLPPLRERMVDIRSLIDRFLGEAAAGGPAKSVSAEVMDQFCAYSWPGNIRELRNIVHMCAAIAQDKVIRTGDLPQNFNAGRSGVETPQLDQIEKEQIEKALAENRYNKARTSQKLGIDRKTLYNKMKNYGIQ